MALQALILAGGEGTRLRPLTETVPKPVLPLVGRPLLTYMLSWLGGHGCERAVISCGFLADGVREVLGDEACGITLSYVNEETPLGTAGAIKNAEALLDERFVALNGDILMDIDLTALANFHASSGAQATIALTPVDDPSSYGLVRTGPTGEVTDFLEKPKAGEMDTNLINAGAYVLQRSVLDLVVDGQNVSIERDIFPKLVGRGLYARADRGYWLDIGTPERYLQATQDIIAGRAAPGTKAQRIGEGSEIAALARVDELSVLGQGCKLAEDVVVERSVLFDQVELGPGCHVADSIIATGATLGAGVQIKEGTVVGERVTVSAGQSLTCERVGSEAIVGPTVVAGGSI